MTDHEMLMEDRNAMEDAMSAIERSAGADIWQNRLIWRMCKAIYDLVKVVEKLRKPITQVAERYTEEAEWIPKSGTIRWAMCEYHCSRCNGPWVGALSPPNYCVHCGARMKNEGKSEAGN